MNLGRDYYKDLELTKDASDDDIKKAYRRLAIMYHPDKTQGDKTLEKKFQEINEANQTIGSPDTRNEYDSKSPHGKNYSPFNSFGFGGFGGGTQFNPFEMFNDIFGNQGFNPFRTEEFIENLDVMASINVNLKDVYLNNPIKIPYKKYISCTVCGGSGFDKNSKSDTCELCDGNGRDKFGHTCQYCQGSGKVYTGQCVHCSGEKVELKDIEIVLQNTLSIRGNTKNVHGGHGHQSKFYFYNI